MGHRTEQQRADGMILAVSDQSELSSLRDRLRDTPGLRVVQLAGKPSAGELGALDVLQILASSGVLVMALKILPDFLQSRRSEIIVTIKVNGQEYSVTAKNVLDVMPVLERVLDARRDRH